MKTTEIEKKYKWIIVGLSIIIPVVVAALFSVKIEGYNTSFLPPVYATINGLTAVVLILAVRSIRKGNRVLHQKLMTTAVVLSIAFLLLYVVYHATSDSTPFGGEGMIRWIYFFLLLTHIVLSIAIIPLVLFTYVRALAQSFDRHKKLARITFPIWLYVAISGVVVYLMISPYYV